jgi:hypothetical protein
MSEQIKKSTYTEAQKRATYNYINKNREKINEYNNKQYHKHMEDPEFVQRNRDRANAYRQKMKDDEEYKAKRREQSKRYYQRKKLEKLKDL